MSSRFGDKLLLTATIVLVLVGSIVYVSAAFSLLAKSPSLFVSAVSSQFALGLMGGSALCYILFRTPTQQIRAWAYIFFGLSLFATCLVFIPGIGVTVNGASRWVSLFGLSFQPSEFLKIGVVLATAAWISSGRDRIEHLKGLLPVLGILALAGVLLLLQPDTDTFIIIGAASFAMLLAAGMKWRIAIGSLATALVLLGLLVFMRPYLLERVVSYMNPTADLQGSGYQVHQSLIAIGSGEMSGRGFGQSIQKYGYLPEATTDSIFAVYAEEFGFVGSTMLILIYLIFGLRGLWVAGHAEDKFSALLAVGIVVIIVFQAFFNIASMTGLLPVGGLPLPFMSHGGTALLCTLAMAGLLLNVSRRTVVQVRKPAHKTR